MSALRIITKYKYVLEGGLRTKKCYLSTLILTIVETVRYLFFWTKVLEELNITHKCVLDKYSSKG